MEASMDQILIWAISRYRHPDALIRYQKKSHELLTALRSTHHKFLELASITTDAASITPHDLNGLRILIESKVGVSDNPADYLNLQSNGSLGPDTLSRIGFSISYCSYEDDIRSLLAPDKGGLNLSLQGVSAGREPNAQAILKLPCDVARDIHHPALLREFLRLFIEKWECDLGGVSLRNYLKAVKADDQASYAGQWLFYLPFSNLAKCLPSDIRHEPFADGILIETTPHAPDANNPADVAAGKRVRDVLDEFGLVNDATYAIEGWPPDREEALYEQFISGAPPGRKYAVHCVNFDGYDPDRKVLLYAKLFRPLRRHPKEWGLRGWDGPVLNEAKRQVRAAAKAGGVPVEWHIGLEEPAHQVRQLLADYTSITEQQLRVIHTPLDEALRSSPP